MIMQVRLIHSPIAPIFQYTYDVNQDCGFTFNTLAEVGEPYQAEAKRQRDAILQLTGGQLGTIHNLYSVNYMADCVILAGCPAIQAKYQL
jgi:hypothetical protein